MPIFAPLTCDPERMPDSNPPQRHDRLHTKPSQAGRSSVADGRSPGRHDRDRLLYSEGFQRLVDVTQVVTPENNGRITTNRLTHSLKVAQVARSIADNLLRDHGSEAFATLGGLDAEIVEAAALAHDLGHPPFGHIGESTLDRLALDAGLVEGFEGNAQSFRIVTRLEAKKTLYAGLNLTAATRGAILKYPWLRESPPEDAWPPKIVDGKLRCDHEAIRRACKADATYKLHWKKFGVYEADRVDFDQARAIHPEPGSHRQSLEASIMDIADDITYALHDLEDFYQAGLFDGARAAAELRGWDYWERRSEDERRTATTEDAGGTFARLWADLRSDYPDLLDDGQYSLAIAGALNFINGSVYAEAFRGSAAQLAQLRSITSGQITTFLQGIALQPAAPEPSPWIALEAEVWHLVQVLKHLTRSFIINRTDVALAQIGQQRVLLELGEAMFGWVSSDPKRLPIRLREGLADKSDEEAPRSVIDFLAALTDHQAYQVHAALHGRATMPLTASFLL